MHCEIVIIRSILACILAYGWIVQCSEHPDIKAYPPTSSRLFPVPPGKEVNIDVQTRRDISRTVEDSHYWVLKYEVICASSIGTATDDLE